ncbi:MAG: GNAT family N-acetyltransferase [Lunatimonas sp.]|uniref:GNAT family N-acetyltransferase n=1 Tax=Lunatimonas sp. TaxID=2060141 RepID=UPI00263A444F|nr:GNAT family N-acetyltransferase [Lunatimonas sp.]MCC5938395.1 GNAT family N-acetyltransferase [Lunatimonas sp.]
MANPIQYQTENTLSVEEFSSLLQRSTLGERRPIDDKVRLQSMLQHANLIVTARDGDLLVGISRALSDFAFCTYLSDLAVDARYQKQGIGKELIRHTKLAAPLAKLILISAPKAVNYYPKIGMQRHENCYILEDINSLH